MVVVMISPTQPGVATMLAESAAYMAALYPAESNHMTDVSTLADPAVTLFGIVEDGEAVSCGALVRQAKRAGRVFIDWLGNGRGSTAVLPYSARARPGAPIAAPVSWTELRTMDRAARWTAGDAAELLHRARQAGLDGWGVHDQLLPDV